jgi:alginate O-acetyltransferase complex protein AlgI
MLFLVVTFMLGGLWHGASWNFVLWGLANGLGLAVVRGWARSGLKMPGALAWALTFAAVNLGWVLFRSPDLATAGNMFAALFGARGFGTAFARPDVITSATLALACVAALLPVNSMALIARMRFTLGARFATASLLAAALVSLANPTEFLYFNF